MKTDIRTITEAIAALSVVLSLIFVGLEIQQSSSAARAEALLAFTTSYAELVRTIGEDPELASLMFEVANGLKSGSDLTLEEGGQVYTLYLSNMILFYGLYSAVQEHVLPEEYLSLLEDPFLDTTVFREAWPAMSVQFGSEFSDLIDKRVLNN